MYTAGMVIYIFTGVRWLYIIRVLSYKIDTLFAWWANSFSWTLERLIDFHMKDFFISRKHLPVYKYTGTRLIDNVLKVQT